MSAELAYAYDDIEVTEVRSKVPWWVKRASEDLKADHFWVTGGLGSGKSHGSAIWFHDRMSLNARSKIAWAVAPTHRKVEDILIASYQKVLERHYGLYPSIHYSITKAPYWKIVFDSSGQEVHFHSGDRPELLVGSNIHTWWLTEPGIMKEEVFLNCQERLRCPDAVVRQGIGEGTPEGLDTWFEREANFGEANGDDWNPETLARRFTLWTDDNTELMTRAPDYIPRLVRTHAHNPTILESYRYGRFVAFNVGGVYKNFIGKCITLDVKADPMLPIYFCWDFNHTPLAWVVIQRQPYIVRGQRRHRFVALAESNGLSSQLEEGIEEFRTQFPLFDFKGTPIYIMGDRSGHAKSHKIRGSDYDFIKKSLKEANYQHPEIKAQKEVTPVAASAAQVDKLFMYQEYVVAAWCKNLIDSYRKTKWKPGTRDIEKPPGETWTHYQEATRSPLWKLTKGWDFTNLEGAAPITNWV